MISTKVCIYIKPTKHITIRTLHIWTSNDRIVPSLYFRWRHYPRSLNVEINTDYGKQNDKLSNQHNITLETMIYIKRKTTHIQTVWHGWQSEVPWKPRWSLTPLIITASYTSLFRAICTKPTTRLYKISVRWTMHTAQYKEEEEFKRKERQYESMR